MKVAEAVAVAAIVRAAEEGGVLAALAEGPRRPTELADALGLDPRSLGLTLDALVALGVLRRDGQRVGLDAGVGGSPLGLAGEVHLWAHTPRWLRTGVPVNPADLQATAVTYHHVVPALATLWGDAPARLAAAIPLTPSTILDLGCGAGPWSLAVAERHPRASVTGIDLPGVGARFLEAALARGLGDRARSVEGDLDALPDPAPERYDLVVLANVLRLDGAAAHGRARGAARCAAPGGAILVVDALAGGAPEAELARTLYAVHLALRRANGALVDGDALAAWFAEAGFPHVLRVPLDPCPGALEARLYTARPIEVAAAVGA